MKWLAVLSLTAMLFAGCALSVQQSSAVSSHSDAPVSSSSSSSSSSSVTQSQAVSSGVSSSSEVSSHSASSSSISSSSQPEEAEQLDETQQENLWQLVQTEFEKPVYGAESTRIYFRIYNGSSEPIYLMRDYQMEIQGENGWTPLGSQKLDSLSTQYPIASGESRLVGVWVQWLQQPNERYGDGRIPEGNYRLQICCNRGYWFVVPFEIQPDPLEQDTTLYEIRTVNDDYLTTSTYIDYEIINKTDEELGFSYHCILERWDGEVWKRVKGEDSIPSIAIILMPGKSTRESYSLAGYSLPLEPGRYRLVKTLQRNNYYAEFDVDVKITRPVEELTVGPASE